MIQRIALKLTNFIFKNATLDSELFEIYKYGVEITISTMLNIALIIAASVAVSDILSGVIFLAIFISIRSFVGGYHAKTYFMCNAIFVLTYLVVFGVNYLALIFIENDLLTKLLTSLILLGLIPIIAFAPVKNPNKPLSDKQAYLCRTIGISAYILISFIALVLRFSGINYGSFIVITLTAISVMILIEIIKTRRCKRDDQGENRKGYR